MIQHCHNTASTDAAYWHDDQYSLDLTQANQGSQTVDP
jgi:hypothetical protein